jgi:hypothetical protein
MIKNLSNNSQKNMVKIERMPEKTKLGKGKVKNMRKRKKTNNKNECQSIQSPLGYVVFSLPKK